MRILQVIHGFPPHAHGGSEIYAKAHARTLRHSFGDEVVVLTRDADPHRPEYAVREELTDGLRIVRINNTFRLTASLEESYRNPPILRIAERLLDEFKPDVAHIHHLTCLSTDIAFALRSRQIPAFLTLHDYWLMCHRGQLLNVDGHVCPGPGESGCHSCLGGAASVPAAAGMAARLSRTAKRVLPDGASQVLGGAARRVGATIASADRASATERERLAHMRAVCEAITHFFAPCAFMKAQFTAFGITESKISVSPYGFDAAPFADVAKARGREPGAPLRLGFLGSLMVSKGPHLLVEACRDLPAHSVSVAFFGATVPYHGDDTYRQQLMPLLRENFVRHVGPIAHDSVPQSLATLDALVVPSIWPENSPLVIQEAFLAGVPVVASRIGGIPEVVRDGVNGLLFEPGDASDLARILRRVQDEPSLLTTLRQGIPSVRTIEDDVRATRESYAEHAHSRSRPSPSTPEVAAQQSLRRIVAVVVNYRAPDETLLAVRSLAASARPLQEIVVVDNETSDHCRRALSEVCGAVTYVPTAENLGFSGGVNVGIRSALGRGADAVLLVNSDAVVPPDCVGQLLGSVYAADKIGIAGPVIRSRVRPARIESAGIAYSTATGRMKHHRATGVDGMSYRVDDHKVRAVSGCVMLIRREVFETIGLFDEDYFYTFEDIDFCLRAARAGFVTWLSAAATVYHQGGRSAGASKLRPIYFAARNHLLINQRLASGRGRVAQSVRAGVIVALNLAYAIRNRHQPLTTGLRDVYAGCRDHVFGRYGNPAPTAQR